MPESWTNSTAKPLPIGKLDELHCQTIANWQWFGSGFGNGFAELLPSNTTINQTTAIEPTINQTTAIEPT
jgi:hypothetical protein